MRLYADSAEAFIRDVRHTEIAPKLVESFEHAFGHRPSPGEVASWRNSLSHVASVLEASDRKRSGVLLEYLLPWSARRLDCVLTGSGGDGPGQALVIELKQWTQTLPSDAASAVETVVNGARRDLLHPSIQVGRYAQYLRDFQTCFQGEGALSLGACAYLHNYELRPNDPILAPKFSIWTGEFPVFGERDFGRIVEFLRTNLGAGPGLSPRIQIERSEVRPSIEFIEHLAGVIDGTKAYRLLDDQQLVFDRVIASVERAFETGESSVVIADGGPGTGKTAIAVNLLGELLRRKQLKVNLVTGSGSLTRTLREQLGPRVDRLFHFTNRYARATPGEYDVLIVDEAHRLRKRSTDFFRRPLSPEGIEQVDEILRAARVAVFFIDDRQRISRQDAGSSSYIRSRAKKLGRKIRDYRLSIQFRCRGTDSYVAWLDSTLGLSEEPAPKWKNTSEFEFIVCDSAKELRSKIRDMAAAGHRARLMAGYCWKWSYPDSSGQLENDVKVDGIELPWNARERQRGGGHKLAAGIPPAQLWAHDPNGVNQVGCIYTAQGFEFDYAGVIFGPDVSYDGARGAWRGQPEFSFDSELKRAGPEFGQLALQSYRVLLTRGIRGCLVYFTDSSTRDHFRSRIV